MTWKETKLRLEDGEWATLIQTKKGTFIQAAGRVEACKDGF